MRGSRVGIRSNPLRHILAAPIRDPPGLGRHNRGSDPLGQERKSRSKGLGPVLDRLRGVSIHVVVRHSGLNRKDCLLQGPVGWAPSVSRLPKEVGSEQLMDVSWVEAGLHGMWLLLGSSPPRPRSGAVIRTKAVSPPSPSMLNGGTARNRLLAWLVMEQTGRPLPVPVVLERWTLPFNRGLSFLAGFRSLISANTEICTAMQGTWASLPFPKVACVTEPIVWPGCGQNRFSSGDSIAVRLSV